MSRLLVTNKSFELLEPYEGNSHVRFLEGKAPVRGLTYSTLTITSMRRTPSL